MKKNGNPIENEAKTLPQLMQSTTMQDEIGPSSRGISGEQRRMVIGIIVGIIFFVAVIIFCVVILYKNPQATTTIRDIFIIFMGLMSLLTGVVLVILILQLARLINLLQNEIKPIIDSVNETTSHLRGTTVFLSENLVAPIIKLNEYMAGLSQLFQVIGLGRKKTNK
jgi:hypothetical protein